VVEQFDLIIVGGGAAGFAAAIKANELRYETLLVNDKSIGIGGTCVNVGCLPTKHLLYLGEVIHRVEMNNLNGLNASLSFDFAEIIAGKDKLVGELRRRKYEEVLDALVHVRFVEGDGQVISGDEIAINGEVYRGKRFIIATGSTPSVPPIPGIEEISYLTNVEALNLKRLPGSLVILGGGPLGVEFAQMFSRFGVKVCVLQLAGRIVEREEPELADLLREYLQGEGVEICTGVEVKKVLQDHQKRVVEAVVDGEERVYRGERLLVAAGRRPRTEGLGLEKMNVELGRRGEIKVDEYLQAGERVRAAGDVIGEPMLETVAAREGMIAANNALSEDEVKMDYRVVPHAVFTDPQLAGVGLTDEQAGEEGLGCRCSTIPLELVPKAEVIRDTRGAIKMVVSAKTGEILGIHILAPGAADLIQEGVMILRERMTVDDVINTLHVFPTLSEATKIVAQSFRRDITKMSCCVE